MSSNVLGGQAPRLFRHHKGSTYVVLNDAVIDATNRYADPLEADRRMVLYTDGSLIFVRPRSEFFGVDADTGAKRFTPIEESQYMTVLEDPELEPGVVKLINERGAYVKGVNIGHGG